VAEANVPVRRRTFTVPFGRDGALVFAATMAANAGAYALHFVASRRLGAVEYGDLYALITAITLLAILTTSATLMVAKTSAGLTAAEHRPLLAAFVRWVMTRAAVVGLIVTVASLLGMQFVIRFLHVSQPAAVAVWAVVLGASVLVPALSGILQGVQDFTAFAYVTVAGGVGRAVLGIAAVLLGFGATGVLVANVGALAIAAAIAIVALRHDLALEGERFRPNAHFRWGSAGTIVATVCSTALAAIDVLLAKHFLTPYDAGIYSVDALCGKMLLFAAGFIPALLVPKVASALAAGRSGDHYLRDALALTLTFCLAGLAIFAVAPGLVVRTLAGSAYSAAAPNLLGYGIAMTLLAATNVIISYKIAAHRFAFVAPLVVVVLCEVGAMSVWHRDIPQILIILIASNAAALLASLWGLGVRWGSRDALGKRAEAR
jgi:O-antigen/teichoic acid export membrane protein